jgi:hypothetical protein
VNPITWGALIVISRIGYRYKKRRHVKTIQYVESKLGFEWDSVILEFAAPKIMKMDHWFK